MRTRRPNQYIDFREQAVDSSLLDGTIVIPEVGSRGFLVVKQQLLKYNKKQWEAFLISVAQTLIRHSLRI